MPLYERAVGVTENIHVRTRENSSEPSYNEPIDDDLMVRPQQQKLLPEIVPEGKMAMRHKNPMALKVEIEEQRQPLIVGPRRLEMEIPAHCHHWRDGAQFIQDSWIVQITGVQDEVHTRKPFLDCGREGPQAVGHVCV